MVGEGSGPTFSTGDSFQSFLGLEENLQAIKARNYVKFWRRDARTITCRTLKQDCPSHITLRGNEDESALVTVHAMTITMKCYW